MKLAIYSDIHLEFHDKKDAKTKRIVQLLNRLPEDVDAIAFLGDLDYIAKVSPILKLATSFAEHVLFVAGNHEYYWGGDMAEAMTALKKATSKNGHIHVLDRDIVEISGIRFLGATLWFPPHPLDVTMHKNFHDFTHIKGFKDNYADIHQRDYQFFADNLSDGDVALSHHAPHPLCINPKYKGDSFNRFYYTNMDALLQERTPKLWAHGHMHTPVSLVLEPGIRIESNPVGYPMEPQHVKPKIIEL